MPYQTLLPMDSLFALPHKNVIIHWIALKNSDVSVSLPSKICNNYDGRNKIVYICLKIEDDEELRP